MPNKPDLVPVEHGIPLTPPIQHPHLRRMSPRRAGLHRLGVGDSVYLPGLYSPPTSMIDRAHTKFSAYPTTRRFTYRTVFDEEGRVLGYRIWRII